MRWGSGVGLVARVRKEKAELKGRSEVGEQDGGEERDEAGKVKEER